MASHEHHRSTAEELLQKAQSYGPSAAARLSVLAEAQVHATLALSAPPQPIRYMTGAEPTEEDLKRVAAGFAVDQPEPAPAPKPRTRRKATAKKSEEADK
ncbi:hypothetical protein SEA_KEALII_48 [Arthrobacter phage KeAlii]|uniref:Uncharacterized protein n=1 Tax=Arthrobacter phage KeAlii TaxID=2885973 RepID=A0AA94WXE4_9CAUD|nr:hypothetical protein PQE15_gp48 [Arthrobacter phage KeAlii]UDL14654.1 hypothetical protein SEA_KEALII_48 [Arthrobacter phage KeAlii]